MAKTSRKERIPVSGARDILTVANKDPNYEYRWVLDVPGRLEKFKDGGWEPVQEDLEVGQSTVDRGTKIGSVITKHAGRAMTLVLMRIPKEWYDEDQDAKQDRVTALEESMMRDIRSGRIPGGEGAPGYGGEYNTHVTKGKV